MVGVRMFGTHTFQTSIFYDKDEYGCRRRRVRIKLQSMGWDDKVTWCALKIPKSQ